MSSPKELKTQKKRRMGAFFSRQYIWNPDQPDRRDFFRIFKINSRLEQETKVDLRPLCPPIYDQEGRKDIPIFPVFSAFQFDQGLRPEKVERSILDQALCFEWSQSGEIRETIKMFVSMMPLDHEFLYHRIEPTLDQIRATLTEGYPIIFGLKIYPSFEDSAGGEIPLPEKYEKALGGHVLLAVGFNDTDRTILFSNSWGRYWGDEGYGYLPYDYILNPELVSDLWILSRRVNVFTKLGDV
jgi:hypothetical protein